MELTINERVEIYSKLPVSVNRYCTAYPSTLECLQYKAKVMEEAQKLADLHDQMVMDAILDQQTT